MSASVNNERSACKSASSAVNTTGMSRAIANSQFLSPLALRFQTYKLTIASMSIR